MTTLAPSTHAGILGSWTAHHRADLAAHLDTHGPLPLPARHDRAWPSRLAGEIEAAGLTGRGGAAFPSARKLAATARAGQGPTVVVNAMEGEPASDKDRVLLSVAPHLVLDGATLVALALGARRVVICIAADDDDTASHVQRTLAERGATGTLVVPVEVARPPARMCRVRNRHWSRGSTAGRARRPSAPTSRSR